METKLERILLTIKNSGKNIDDPFIQDYIDGEIEAMEHRGNTFKKKSNDPNNTQLQKEAYKSFEELTRREADRIRSCFGRIPIHNEILNDLQEEVDNNPLVGLEKFKKYIRENWKDIALIGGRVMSIAGLIADIVSLVRNTTKKSNASHSVQKTGSDVGEKVSPLVGKITTENGKIMSWIADHPGIAIMGFVLLIIGKEECKKQDKVWFPRSET